MANWWKSNERIRLKEENVDPLGDYQSKIPRDLIISPASPTLDLLEDARDHHDQKPLKKNEHHEIQFHLDLKDFEDVDIKFNGSE
ncbi:unnamed protein product, partial [Allacma fusca]